MTSSPTIVQVTHEVVDPDIVYELYGVIEQGGTIVPGTLSEPWTVSDTLAILKVSESIHIGYSTHDDSMELLYIPDPAIVTGHVIGMVLKRTISDIATLTIIALGRQEDGDVVLFVANLSMLVSDRLQRFYDTAVSTEVSE